MYEPQLRALQQADWQQNHAAAAGINVLTELHNLQKLQHQQATFAAPAHAGGDPTSSNFNGPALACPPHAGHAGGHAGGAGGGVAPPVAGGADVQAWVDMWMLAQVPTQPPE